MKTKNLEKVLKNHAPTCTIHLFSADERRCSCGRDAALVELYDLRAGYNWALRAYRWFQNQTMIVVSSTAVSELEEIMKNANEKPN